MKKTALFLTLALLIGGGIYTQTPSPVSCPNSLLTDTQHIGNAGCLIQRDGKILMVRQAKTGKLNFPGGTAEKGEAAACTAYRETLEETGQPIVVKSLFYHYINPDFYLFECELEKDVADFAIPSHFKHEIKEAFFVDIKTISKDKWRFPEEMEMLKDIL
ncbi:MAG: NUDIX hydrolase [Alphaproteobacteria bacterium]|nr:NUDIX hydrolase [Alphaproteobacteria bacterium]MBN2780004.1 NUDIX hydrolase [Alphaproteobacteria bacterium]